MECVGRFAAKSQQVLNVQCDNIVPSDQGDLGACLNAELTSWTADQVVLSRRKTNYIARKAHSDNNQFLGFYLARNIADFVELLFICVLPNLRQQGVGRLLMSDLFIESQKLKVKSLELEVRESNMAAIKLYTDCGFTEVGRRENYYPADQTGENRLSSESAVLFGRALS